MSWSSDAKRAMQENPDYFIWWYTAKSIGLGVVAAVAAYYIGKDVAHKGSSLRGLPARGRIPMPTVVRVLKRLPKRRQACKGMSPAALREGMEIEREHRDLTKGRVLQTAKIAAAHICERADYYKRIKRYVER